MTDLLSSINLFLEFIFQNVFCGLKSRNVFY
jgi:hypothetical protein